MSVAGNTPVHFTSLHFTSLHRTAPHRTAPHRTAPHRTTPHRTTPHHTSPHRTRMPGVFHTPYVATSLNFLPARKELLAKSNRARTMRCMATQYYPPAMEDWLLEWYNKWYSRMRRKRPGVCRPTAIGLKTDEIRRTISIGGWQPL
jgi:hypothetical protein